MSETWVAGILATPREPEWLARAPWAQGTIEDVHHRPLRMIVKHQLFPREPNAAYVVWEVREGARTVAAGTAYNFPARPDTLVIGASAVARGDRHRGIYPRVLAALRAINGGPIESDLAMTEAAVRAWSKLGAVDAKRMGVSVLRVNPTRSQRRRARPAAPEGAVVTGLRVGDRHASREQVYINYEFTAAETRWRLAWLFIPGDHEEIVVVPYAPVSWDPRRLSLNFKEAQQYFVRDGELQVPRGVSMREYLIAAEAWKLIAPRVAKAGPKLLAQARPRFT